MALESLRAVSGRLVVCPTPIGNLEDVTLRVLSALREADVVACEDTRRTRVLLDRYGVKARLVSYHEHNERARAAELVERMRAGAVVALVSDAGMPLVSDPGYVLVRACVAAGLPVEVLPGPSAAITALVASGLPADEWRFPGFLPRKKGELRERARRRRGTLVAFESPRRLPATLALLAELDPDREVAVCRELTKVHEEVVRGTRRRAGRALRGRAAEGRGRAGDRAAASAPDVAICRRPAALEAAPAAGRRRRPPAQGGRRRGLAHGHKRKRAVPALTRRVRSHHERAQDRHLASASALARRVRTVGRHAAASLPRPRSPSVLLAAPPADAAWVWPVCRRGHHALPQRRPIRTRTASTAASTSPAPVGTPVVAAAAGEVRFAGTAGSSGLTVGDPDRRRRYDTSYLHLSSLAVRAGEHVSAGRAHRRRRHHRRRSARHPHLHFGVRDAGTRHDYHDPLAFLPPPPAGSTRAATPGTGRGTPAGTARGPAGRSAAHRAEATRGAAPPPAARRRTVARSRRPTVCRTPPRIARRT